MIVGISGKARHGKNTFAMFLSMHLKAAGTQAEQLSFAHRLKKDAMLMGWNGEKDVLGRFTLERFGKLMRDKSLQFPKKDYWIAALGRANPGLLDDDKQIRIITDVRYKNEAAWVRESGGVLIRVEKTKDGVLVSTSEHPVETELDRWTDWDWIVSAEEGDLDEIWEMAEKVALWLVYRL